MKISETRAFDEDVAHIAVRLTLETLSPLVDHFFLHEGYRRVPLKGARHLLGPVDWASPFDPPAAHRCLMLVPGQDGWSTVVDQLDHLDMELAMSLSMSASVIAIRGYHELDESEYLVLEQGRVLTDGDLPDSTKKVLEFMRLNPDHVTRFRYDELCLSLPRRLGSDGLEYLAYSLGKA